MAVAGGSHAELLGDGCVGEDGVDGGGEVEAFAGPAGDAGVGGDGEVAPAVLAGELVCAAWRLGGDGGDGLAVGSVEDEPAVGYARSTV